MGEGGCYFFVSWMLKENIEDFWFLRGGGGGCRFEERVGKGNVGRFRSEINDELSFDMGWFWVGYIFFRD